MTEPSSTTEPSSVTEPNGQTAPVGAAQPDASAPLMHVVGGSPAPEERAAIEAVLVGMAEEWAETKHRRVLDAESDWQARARTPTGHRWKRD